jgi:hypothetical protein
MMLRQHPCHLLCQSGVVVVDDSGEKNNQHAPIRIGGQLLGRGFYLGGISFATKNDRKNGG